MNSPWSSAHTHTHTRTSSLMSTVVWVDGGGLTEEFLQVISTATIGRASKLHAELLFSSFPKLPSMLTTLTKSKRNKSEGGI